MAVYRSIKWMCTGVQGRVVYISNVVNLQDNANNTEVAMKLKTSIPSRHYFSDLNGFQVDLALFVASSLDTVYISA